MATTNDASDNDPAKVPGLTTVKVEVNGTTVMPNTRSWAAPCC
jgi:hypothetical protein